MRALALVILLGSAVAFAKPDLVPFDAGTFNVATPKGWTVKGDAANNLVLAQQDPKRKDGAQALVMIMANTQTTEDQVIDLIANKTVTNLKVIKREAMKGGGKELIADGVADGINVRLGAIAIGNGQGVVFGLVVAKAGDFDGLGGIAFVTQMLGSIKVNAPAPVASTGKDAVMTPQYDYYHSLIIPPPARTLTLADLEGEWTNDSKALTNYYSASTGAHTGYSSVALNDIWWIDSAKGELKTKTHGAVVSSSHVQAIDSTKKATIALSADGVLSIVFSDFPSQTSLYMVRGWFVGADVTMLSINGPWYNTIPDNARPAGKNNALNNVMVRAKK